MKPVFEILPEAIFFQQTNLICEISPDGFSYIFENDTDKKFYGLSVFQFEYDADVATQLQTIFAEQALLGKHYKKVFVSYVGDQNALLPQEVYKQFENELLLNTLYGDLETGTIAADVVTEKKICNVYRMPAAVHKTILNQFPQAALTHYYSLFIKQNFYQDDFLTIIFYKDTFIAALLKAGELQIINTYPYQSGADVVYHLLSISNQFKMNNILLKISGMIEMDGDLHKEIAHYFQHIQFEKLPEQYEYAKELKELQPHYFSHLFSIALCV